MRQRFWHWVWRIKDGSKEPTITDTMTIFFFFPLDARSLLFLIMILDLLQSDSFFASHLCYHICCTDKPRTIS